ncbi:MAG: hypothetical protein O3C40_11305 [Planctomycetota bacterium]|nr:hypothetical protein [Planctomycetota bacterium]
MNRPSKIILFAFMLLCAFVCLSDVASACPTCKDGMAGDPAYSNMVKGYFWSILFMMSMPFLVFSGVAAYFYYEVRRARARRASVATAGSTDASSNASAIPEIALPS